MLLHEDKNSGSEDITYLFNDRFSVFQILGILVEAEYIKTVTEFEDECMRNLKSLFTSYFIY